MNNRFVKFGCVLAAGLLIIDTPGEEQKNKSIIPAADPVNLIREQNPSPTFNAVRFEDAVNKRLKDLPKGYAIVVANKQGIQGRAEGGWAQDPTDGNLKMTTKIPSCIGSCSKMLAVAALLNLLEAMPGVKLDDPVFSKLPKKWQQKYKNSRVECITYRQLLQHRSGFRKGSDTGNLDSLGGLSGSCPTTAIGWSYNNSNISLFRYLVTNLAYPQEGEAIEKKLADLSFDEYAKQANIEFGFPYERYIKKHILEKGLTPVTASCRPDGDFMPTAAKGYQDRNDKTGSLKYTTAQHQAAGNHCAPQGSWYLSAEMLAHFGRTLLCSNNYLTTTTLNMLYDPVNSAVKLGWASESKHDGFGKETGQSKWPWHDGAEPVSEGRYFALLIQLPYGYVGAAVINSSVNVAGKREPLNNSTFLADVILNSFYDATHAGTSAEIAKHAIPESQYQEEFTMIRNSGYYPAWVDAYDVNGKTFFNAVFRPDKESQQVSVKHGMTRENYQQEYDEWVKQKGYRLEQLESYTDGGRLKFAAIFIKKPGRAAAQPAYHGLSPEEHQSQFEKYTGEGYVPVNVSVAVVGGKKYYSAFYEKRNTGGCILKSALTQQDYQDMYEANKNKGWEQAYINAYSFQDKTYFSVIWYKNAGFSNAVAVRKADGTIYQQKWEENTGKGLLTRCVTGYEEGGKHWFAAQWAK